MPELPEDIHNPFLEKLLCACVAGLERVLFDGGPTRYFRGPRNPHTPSDDNDVLIRDMTVHLKVCVCVCVVLCLFSVFVCWFLQHDDF